jgi:hypothetical protein
MTQLNPIIVWCTWLEELGQYPITSTRVHGNQQFCINCGATDHREAQ